jgi:hypothetical protein
LFTAGSPVREGDPMMMMMMTSFSSVSSVLFFFGIFVEPPVKILFFLQAHPIVKRLLKRSRAIVIAKKIPKSVDFKKTKLNL